MTVVGCSWSRCLTRYRVYAVVDDNNGVGIPKTMLVVVPSLMIHCFIFVNGNRLYDVASRGCDIHIHILTCLLVGSRYTSSVDTRGVYTMYTHSVAVASY